VTSILATAPCRADLAGGTLDLWPLYLFHPRAVTVNFALSIVTTCRITAQRSRAITLRSLDTKREETFADLNALLAAKKYLHSLAAYVIRHFAVAGSDSRTRASAPHRIRGGFTLETDSQSPAGAGISGSSALMIATCAALARFTGRRFDKEQLRQLAQDVEAQLIRVPTGCQDYYPALYGGVSVIHLYPGGVRRLPINVPPEEIEKRFLLAYTGAPRQSGINNWEVFKAHIDGSGRVFRNFEQIAAIANGMRAALMKQDWNEISRLLRAEWTLRRTNAPGITTPMIDALVRAASRVGSRAAKVCGAGGGGCVLFFIEPEARARVSAALTSLGAQVLPFRVHRRGLTFKVV
jgi:D-glycero-alpha-D-manno-heptose-7-phosphate kinase